MMGESARPRPCPPGPGDAADTGRPGGLVSRERGSGTVLVIGVVAVALSLLLAVGVLAEVQLARRDAQAAADLAALAATRALNDPRETGSPCNVAHRVAEANDTAATNCTVKDREVTVVTRRALHPLGLGTWQARAKARAGPVDSLVFESNEKAAATQRNSDPACIAVRTLPLPAGRRAMGALADPAPAQAGGT